MRVVGLTGGIACGKSTVVSILKENGGFPIIDCDELAHSVTAVGTPAYRRIVEKFGASICRADNGGEIDRDKLGRIVFGDRDARAWLNGVTHWRIGVAIAKRILWHWMIRGDRVVILDAPLLFESGLQRIAHPIVCVSLLPQTQLERLMARDKIDGAFARAKIDAQMDTATKVLFFFFFFLVFSFAHVCVCSALALNMLLRMMGRGRKQEKESYK